MSTGIIKIPVLFDMSGDSIVFGEEVSGDFVSSHLDFLLDMTTEANDISLNATDISSAILIGDQDSGDNIFYSGGTSSNIEVDNLCNRIAKAVTRGKLVHIPKTGNSSNSGIPMGGRLYVVKADGQVEVPPDGQYAAKYLTSIAPIGDEQMLGEAMARVTSVHLMGTPLAAAILVDKNSVQTDLETASAQTFNSGGSAFYNALAVQLSKVLGGSKSSAPMNNGANNPLDASGVSCPALKSIYEQLMNVPGRSQIMQTRDVSGVVDNSNVTLTGGFPFIAGDKLVMYLRPKIIFAAQTQAESNNSLYTFNYTGTTVLATPSYNIADKNGSITGQTYSQSSSQDNTNYIFEHATDGNGTGSSAAQYFITANNTYHNTTGVHSGIAALGSTNLVDGANTVAGEWGQVDIGENTWATELLLTTNADDNDRMPTEFKLLGSTNGANWVILIDKTGAGPWVDDTPQTFIIASPGSYRYYRYIIIKCYNAVSGGTISNRGSLGYFNLRGVKYPSEVIENTNAGLMSGSSLDISGLQTNVVSASASIQSTFPGNATTGPEAETSKWGWMGSVNSDSFTLDCTDVTEPQTIDLHIWKITITL